MRTPSDLGFSDELVQPDTRRVQREAHSPGDRAAWCPVRPDMLEDLQGSIFCLCSYDIYPRRNGEHAMPLVSEVKHTLCVQHREVVSVRIRRTGVRRSHILQVKYVVAERPGWSRHEECYFLRDEWRKCTPRFAWTNRALMSKAERRKWNQWLEIEAGHIASYVPTMAGLEEADPRSKWASCPTTLRPPYAHQDSDWSWYRGDGLMRNRLEAWHPHVIGNS